MTAAKAKRTATGGGLDDVGATSRPGAPVDAQGAQAVDPTKNVEDLVKALAFKHSEFRDSDNRYLDSQISWIEKTINIKRDSDMRFTIFSREAGERLDSALRESERVRLNELAATRKEYENTIRDMLAKSVETTSTLVSTQLVQIQATFDKRVSQLEAYQFTQAGRSSVADPALSNALTQLAEGQKLQRDNLEGAMSKMTGALESLKNVQSSSGGAAAQHRESMGDSKANLAMIISVVGVAVLVLLHFLK